MRKPATPATYPVAEQSVGHSTTCSAAVAQITLTSHYKQCEHTSLHHYHSERLEQLFVYRQPKPQKINSAFVDRQLFNSDATLSATQRFGWWLLLQRITSVACFGYAACSTCAGDCVEHNSDLNFEFQSAKVSTVCRLS
ncbi:unnamed protein product [Ceratitis capitata]|uniref:(Mediterranean fruit fly) hypothetical protein n=1 Tax=Ceratitis capitata TaxID=7213 RepID=A0A811UAG2_CERCA|nr:unnamed protein product [Ceratitis capitata]